MATQKKATVTLESLRESLSAQPGLPEVHALFAAAGLLGTSGNETCEAHILRSMRKYDKGFPPAFSLPADLRTPYFNRAAILDYLDSELAEKQVHDKIANQHLLLRRANPQAFGASEQ
jgi:hypothetical protein